MRTRKNCIVLFVLIVCGSILLSLFACEKGQEKEDAEVMFEEEGADSAIEWNFQQINEKGNVHDITALEENPIGVLTAYRNGCLTRRQLQEISVVSHKQFFAINEETLQWNMSKITSEEENAMKICYLQYLQKKQGIDATIEEISIKKCYGRFGEYIGVMFDGGLCKTKEFRTEIVRKLKPFEALQFYYNYTSEQIFFWADSGSTHGKLYTLGRVFEKNKLDHSELKKVSELQNSSAQLEDMGIMSKDIIVPTGDEATIAHIKTRYADLSAHTEDELTTVRYYGVVGDRYIAYIWGKSFIDIDVIRRDSWYDGAYFSGEYAYKLLLIK